MSRVINQIWEERQKWNLKFVESVKNYTFCLEKLQHYVKFQWPKQNALPEDTIKRYFNILKTKCNYEEAPGIDKTRSTNYQENLQILDTESN